MMDMPRIRRTDDSKRSPPLLAEEDANSRGQEADPSYNPKYLANSPGSSYALVAGPTPGDSDCDGNQPSSPDPRSVEQSWPEERFI